MSAPVLVTCPCCEAVDMPAALVVCPDCCCKTQLVPGRYIVAGDRRITIRTVNVVAWTAARDTRIGGSR